MRKYSFILMLMFAGCMPVNNHEKTQSSGAPTNDTTIIKPKNIEGLWEQYNNEYASSFVLIDNDTIYLLKGMASKYYIHHDTLISVKEANFKRKFIKADSNKIIWIDKLHDTIVLRRR